MMDNMEKKILITGGAGFIGINLVRHLLKLKKYSISILDNFSTGNYELLQQVVDGHMMSEINEPYEAHVSIRNGDIRDRQVVDEAAAGQDAVIHLAAQTGVIPSIENPGTDAEINVLGTLNLLQAAVKQGVKKFIFASSAAPLGEQEPPLDESKVPRPLSPYGASKLAGEAYCSAFHGSFGLDTTVLRFSNVYGPLSYHKGSVIALFIKQILAGKRLVIYGDGYQTRDFLYVGDVCRIIAEIIQADSQKTGGEIFQLGTGVETSVNELVLLLNNLSPDEFDIRFEPERKGEIKRNYTSPQKLFQTLGIKPETRLEKGLGEMWQWFLTIKQKL
ncbi:MAG: NAD-dependent epimerase/dehydratase family protein [bacterium]|nr:NAD-dependent epimerase/dehydratase family protein [bacterium]